ncbi:MAG: peptidylprolyl isomerase [Deltaproteobacteria bacterium]|nr:peptidylprolyl isomerase [Deltaproteobacteria bacterium]
MKIFKIGIVISVFSIIMAVSSHAEMVDRIVAIINDEIITLSELNNNLETYMKRVEQSSEVSDREKVKKQVRKLLLNSLIDQKLITQEAQKLGIAATDDDVDKAIKDILSKKRITMEALAEDIADQGGTIEDYRDEIKQHLTKRSLIGREIRKKVTITQEEIGNYYREHRNDYEGKEAVRIRQILIIVPKDCDVETKEKKRAVAEETLKRLRNSEPFGLLAAEVSQGPAAQTGGDLGYIEKGLILPEVDTVAFSLKKGEISGIIETSVGFHIIQVVDKRGAGIKPPESVREEIVEKLGSKKVEEKFREWLEEQRKKSLIEIRL